MLQTDGTKATHHIVHYTTDGTEPTAASAKYRKPINGTGKLRAAIVVKGKVIAHTSTTTVAASTRTSR